MPDNNQPKQIIHPGRVIGVYDRSVDVSIIAESACASCTIRKACGMDESKEKIITVMTPDARAFRTGEQVEVVMKQAMGFKAIGIVYILPIFLILAILAVMVQSGISEMISGLAALGFLAVYYFAIYLLRHKIAREIRFEIRIPKNNPT